MAAECPEPTDSTEYMDGDGAELAEDDDEDEDIDYEDTGDIQPNMIPRPGKEDTLGNRFVTIVDITGIHHLPVTKCLCPNAAEEHMQYFELSLFPTSYQMIKTIFTFGVLGDFRLSNLECKTTAYQYYSRLRRLTCPAFPKTVLNRYAELRRLSRQYRNLKLWKIHGRGYKLPDAAEQVPTMQDNSTESPELAPNSNGPANTLDTTISSILPNMSPNQVSIFPMDGRRIPDGGSIFGNFVLMEISKQIISTNSTTPPIYS